MKSAMATAFSGLGVTLWLTMVVPAAAQGQQMTVTLLGTGRPPAVMNRFGPSTLVEAGEQKLLFDARRGALQRLTELKVLWQSVHGVFLTHLHSDHVVGFPDLWLTGWLIAPGRNVPLQGGPPGTAELMSHLQRAYKYDITVRIANDRTTPEGAILHVEEIREGLVYRKDGPRVTAFEVDHAPVKPAFGYRIDYLGRSIVFLRSSSGKLSVDVLIHEVFAPETLFRAGVSPERAKSIIDYHTTAAQARNIFTRAEPKIAVYTHVCMPAATEEDLLAPTRKAYTGPWKSVRI